MEKGLEARLDLISARLSDWLNSFFEPIPKTKNSGWITPIWLGGLFILGILLWGYFLHWGALNFNIYDWLLISGPRLAFLRDAVRTGQLPLHISDPATLGGITDRFLAIPDEILSPQVLLLRFISIGRFVYVDVAILYSLGFIGLLWLKRHFSLSAFTFTILFLLFYFNGHILAHYSTGHATWGGYFLFPWFAILVIKLIEGERGWGWVAKTSLLLLGIFLQGSFHQYVWLLLFLVFLAFAKRSYFMPVCAAILFSLLVSMARIAPPAMLVGSFDSQYLAGYLSASDIWTSLVTPLDPYLKTGGPLTNQIIHVWELSLYVGLVGAVFLVFFGIYRWLRGHQGAVAYKELILPIFGSLILSFDSVYPLIRILPLPLLAGERVASRIISLPFLFILILAIVELQRWLEESNRGGTLLHLGALGLLIITCQDLWVNFVMWIPAEVSSAVSTTKFESTHWFVTNHPDPPYITAVVVGTAISLFSILLVLTLAWLARKNPSSHLARIPVDLVFSDRKG